MRIKTKPSHTAKITCFARALAHAEVGGPIANDYLAHRLLSPRTRGRLVTSAERQTILTDELPPEQYSYMTARTAHMDHVFDQALRIGVEQIVMLGAGFDSRAYRFLLPPDLRLFEVDAPTTQASKRMFLDAAEIEVPPQVTFVSVDFLTQSLQNRLLATAYDAKKHTLFIWEGVTYYISADSVDQTLAFIHTHSAPGSIVAFDYLYQAMLEGDHSFLGAENSINYVAEAGEPFIFGIADGQIEPFLQARGFALDTHYTPEQFQTRYLDARFRPMYGYMLNAVAHTESL